MINDLRIKIQDYLHEHHLPQETNSLFVGFSGGADSTALLLLMKHCVSDRITAVHFHHGIRGEEADHDAEHCQLFCQEHKICFHIRYLDIPARKQSRESLEMAARRLRLTEWKQIIKQQSQTATVALGHHLDDLMETFFIRLLRGANSSALIALRPRSFINGVHFIRPFLSVRRVDLLHYLKEQGITQFCQDSSNQDRRYLRNRIRHQLLPLIREIGYNDRGLIQSLSYLEKDAELIELVSTREGIDFDNPLCLVHLKKIDHALWSRLLTAWLSRQSGRYLPIRKHALQRLQNSQSQAEIRYIPLNKVYHLRIEKGLLFLEKNEGTSFVFKPKIWRWADVSQIELEELTINCHATVTSFSNDDLSEARPNESYWNPEAMPDSFMLRLRRPGDRMIPFGGHQSRRIKKLIATAGIPYTTKKHLIVFCHPDGRLLWVPGVCRSSFAMVQNNASKMLRIQVDFGDNTV